MAEEQKNDERATLIVPQQDRIFVFANQDGEIVLEQGPDAAEASHVWFHERHAETIATAILEIAKRIRGEG